MLRPFTVAEKTLKIAVTTAASTSGALPAAGNSVRIVNEGPNTAFVSIGSGTQTATVPSTTTPVATCTPVMAGEDVLFSLPTRDATYNISAITSTGTATLYVSVAEGF